MNALLDTNVLIAAATEREATPDLSGYTSLAVSSLTWAELVRGLNLTTDLAQYRARRARLDELRDTFGDGLAFGDHCVVAYDRVMSRVADRGAEPRAHVLDRMIAATALAHGLRLVTRDLTGFSAIAGLVDVDRR